MSIFSGIMQGLGRATSVLGGISDIASGLGTIRTVGTTVGLSMPATNQFPALPGVGTGGGFTTGGYMTAGGQQLAGRACGVPGYHYAKDGSGKLVRNRRMNYGNARAAKRAVRRIKGARKLLQSIEKQLPVRTVRSRK